MAILVIAEHDNAVVRIATSHAIGAASRIGTDIHVLVAGSNCVSATQTVAGIAGVTNVLVADAPHYSDQTAENLVALIEKLVRAKPGLYSHILAPSTSFGKNVLPRLAAVLDVAQVSDIVDVHSTDTFVRNTYAGNVLVTLRSSDTIKVITVQMTAFEPAGGGNTAPIEQISVGPDLGLAKLIGRELTKSVRPELASAKVVVSGGRGMGSSENYRLLLEPLADKLEAALGASRAAVDAGYAPNDYQVGQTGKIVAPQLYIAIGISGAIQHLAGMKNSKVVVAINKDPDAPIFQVADYGLVADIFDAVPALTAALN